MSRSSEPDAGSSVHRVFRKQVSAVDAGQRVDVWLASQCSEYSRVFLRGIIQAGNVRVDNAVVKPSFKVQGDQLVEANLPAPPKDGPVPEDLPLEILYEDDALVVINKAPGMVVHPAKGHWSGTLTSALAHHFKQLSDTGGPTRPGIVHRLDRDTSGVIAIAKTNAVHLKLAAQFEAREVRKTYEAITVGMMDRDRDVIKQPIGYHPYQRDKMAIRADHESSREAETQFEVVERFSGYTFMRVFPKTGRTHQIRVHLAHVRCPILCDRLYAGHARVTRGQLLRRQVLRQPPQPGDDDIVLERQALHARRLELAHPVTRKPLLIEAPLPQDMEKVLAILRQQTDRS